MAGTMAGEGMMAAPQAYKLMRDIESDAYTKLKQQQEAEKISMQMLSDMYNLPATLEAQEAQLMQKINDPGGFSFGDLEGMIQGLPEKVKTDLDKISDPDIRLQMMKDYYRGRQGLPPPDARLRLPMRQPGDVDRKISSIDLINEGDDLDGKGGFLVDIDAEGNVIKSVEIPKESPSDEEIGSPMEFFAAPFVGAYEGAKAVGNWLKPPPTPDPFLQELISRRQADPRSAFDVYKQQHPQRMTDAELELNKRRLDILYGAAKKEVDAFKEAWGRRMSADVESGKQYGRGSADKTTASRQSSAMTLEEKTALARYKEAIKDTNVALLGYSGHAKAYINNLKGVLSGLGSLSPALKAALRAEAIGHVNALKSPYKEEAQRILGISVTPEKPAPGGAALPKEQKPRSSGFSDRVKEAQETNRQLRDLIQKKMQNK